MGDVEAPSRKAALPQRSWGHRVRSSGALAAGSAIGFVLERDRQPDPVAGNLAVLDGDVLAGHFGDADFADCRRRGLDRAASSMLPRLGARANDLGHAVDTHSLSLSWAPRRIGDGVADHREEE